MAVTLHSLIIHDVVMLVFIEWAVSRTEAHLWTRRASESDQGSVDASDAFNAGGALSYRGGSLGTSSFPAQVRAFGASTS